MTDRFGLLVDMVLDTKTNTITVTDRDSGVTESGTAFTVGHVNSDGSIITPNAGLEIPAPPGKYLITDNPNPKAGHEDWKGLLKKDDRIDDYFTDNGRDRSGVRLHEGGTSYGCVTVDRNQKDAWGKIKKIINDAKTEDVDFIQGPHWWNSKGKIKKYGDLIIK